jgi:hypothetical protein
VSATRTLIVTALEELTSGERDGRAWTLFAVTATTPDGQPIAEPLRTFERLPTGEPVEVEVKPREDERGTTYTIRRKRSRGPTTAQLRDELAALERRVRRLEERAA